MAEHDKAELSSDDRQAILSLHVPADADGEVLARVCRHAARAILPPKVTFQWSNIRDRYSRTALARRGLTAPSGRRRSPALVRHQKHGTVLSLYRQLALVAVGVLSLPKADRNARKRRERTTGRIFREVRASAAVRKVWLPPARSFLHR